MAERKPTSRFPFTVARLRSLKPPASGRVYHHDKKTPGLTLCVTAAGSKVFFLYRWANGKPTRVRLGAFPGLPIETARLAAEKLNGDIAAGGDPTAERRSPSFGDAKPLLRRARGSFRVGTATATFRTSGTAGGGCWSVPA